MTRVLPLLLCATAMAFMVNPPCKASEVDEVRGEMAAMRGSLRELREEVAVTAKAVREAREALGPEALARFQRWKTEREELRKERLALRREQVRLDREEEMLRRTTALAREARRLAQLARDRADTPVHAHLRAAPGPFRWGYGGPSFGYGVGVPHYHPGCTFYDFPYGYARFHCGPFIFRSGLTFTFGH